MGDDGVRDGAVSGRSWMDVEYLLSQTVRYGVGDSACIYEDALVREVGEQSASVSDTERRVQCYRLPDSVDVGFIDAVLPKDRSSQIGALDLEPSLACRVLTESEVMHDGGGEEQVLVVVGVMQGALLLGQQAGEEKAADAVIEDRPVHRGTRDCKARLGT